MAMANFGIHYWTDDALIDADGKLKRALIQSMGQDCPDPDCDKKLDRITNLDKKMVTCADYCSIRANPAFNPEKVYHHKLDAGLILFRHFLSTPELTVDGCGVQADIDHWQRELDAAYRRMTPQVVRILDSIVVAAQSLKAEFLGSTKGLAAISDEIAVIAMMLDDRRRELLHLDDKADAANARVEALKAAIGEVKEIYALPKDFDSDSVRNLEIQVNKLKDDIKKLNHNVKVEDEIKRSNLFKTAMDSSVEELVYSKIREAVERAAEHL